MLTLVCRISMIQTPPKTASSDKDAAETQTPKVVYKKNGEIVQMPGMCDVESAEEIKYLEMILQAKVRLFSFHMCATTSSNAV